MNKPTVLFLFNSSSYAVQPWLDDGGFNVVSVDYDDTDHSEAHREPVEGHTVLNYDLSQYGAVADIRAMLYANGMPEPSLVVSFAPCTDLAVSGAAHFAKKAAVNPNFQQEAVQMARLAEKFGCPYMVENPVSVLATMWRKPDHYWHPWHFAGYCPAGPHPEFPEVIPDIDRYNKKTGAWCGNGFKFPMSKAIEPLGKDFPGHTKLGGKSARTKYIRSLTPRGFAQAIYEANRGEIMSQWGLTSQLEAPIIQTQIEMEV